VWKHHGLPQKVVSDRGPQFIAEFTQELYWLLGIKLAATMAYHPQGDGQTERVNQELEQYLHLFTNQRQDDWVGLLPFAEFQYNNQVHSSTQHPPFLLDTGRVPCMDFEPDQPRSHMESVNEFKDWMTDTLEEAKAALAKSKDDMVLYYNQKQTPAWSSKQVIWSSLMQVTFRPLDLHINFLTGDWDHSRSTVRLVMVHTGSAFLCQWVDFIPSSMWSNYLWLLQTPFLAIGHLCLHYWKLWMVKKSGWWRKSWIVGWSTRNCITWSNGKVSVLNTIPGNLGIMFMHRNWWRIFTGGTLVLLATSIWSTSAPFLSVQCQDITALKGGWMLGDAPLRPMFPPISFLLIVASPRQSALVAPIPKVRWSCDAASLSPFHHFPSFSSFYYFSSFY